MYLDNITILCRPILEDNDMMNVTEEWEARLDENFLDQMREYAVYYSSK